MSIDLSPGFFNPRMAMSDDDDDIDIVPANINVEEINDVENNDTNENDENDDGDIISFVSFLFVVSEAPCSACSGGWSRTSTY
jgi:hypothetical protein